MSRRYHVTSVRNRESIAAHGLDWTHMGAAAGIAGSTAPEVAGVFLCASEFDADFFVRLNSTGTPVDVWAVEGVAEGQLVTSEHGFDYLPARIPPEQLTLVRRDLAEQPPTETSSGAYSSRLTVTLHDGTVLTGDDVRAHLGD